MIKVIIPLVVSAVFLSSHSALADSPRLSSAIKIMSTGEAMHKKIVSKIKTYPSLAKAEKAKLKVSSNI